MAHLCGPEACGDRVTPAREKRAGGVVGGHRPGVARRGGCRKVRPASMATNRSPPTVILNLFQDPSGSVTRTARERRALIGLVLRNHAPRWAETWILKQVQDDERGKDGGAREQTANDPIANVWLGSYRSTMDVIPQVMLWVFIAAWCVAVVAHIYATRYFIPRWAAGFRKRPEHEGYGRKILLGYGVFIAAILVALAAGGIAELAGGWE